MTSQPKQLIYFADPMCSWCWGFSPVMAQLLTQFGDRLLVHLVMGGLRPGHTAVMDEAQKSYIRNHWEHVADRSGQPFDFTFFDRDGFVYDTEPACRAVVTARSMDPRLAYAAMHAIQRAFYAGGQDVTSTDVLTAIAEAVGLDANAFRNTFESEDARERTAQDFATSKQIGIPGFPTLLIGDGGDQLTVLSNGYQDYEPIAKRVESLLSDSASPASVS